MGERVWRPLAREERVGMLPPPVGVCKPAAAALVLLDSGEGPPGYVGDVGERRLSPELGLKGPPTE